MNKKCRCVNNTGVESEMTEFEDEICMASKRRKFAVSKKKDTPVRLDQLTEEEKMKYEIADELGLLDKVMKDGWKSLSSKETGRIGGILARKRKNQGKK